MSSDNRKLQTLLWALLLSPIAALLVWLNR